MKSETRETRREGKGRRGGGDGDEQMMKRFRWSGREGEMDGIKARMEMTAEMITCINCGGRNEAREGAKDEWRCKKLKIDCGERVTEL